MIHIYNHNLMKQTSIPYTREELEEHGIDKLYPPFQNDWHYSFEDIKYPKLENGMLVEKSDTELKLEGIISLLEGEVIINNEIVVKPKPNGYKIIWNGTEWVETATEEEIREIEFNNSVNFYNSELEFASKATAELGCEIISQEMYADVKAYMQAIDPYAMKKSRMSAPIQRPAIFDKYKK